MGSYVEIERMRWFLNIETKWIKYDPGANLADGYYLVLCETPDCVSEWRDIAQMRNGEWRLIQRPVSQSFLVRGYVPIHYAR